MLSFKSVLVMSTLLTSSSVVAMEDTRLLDFDHATARYASETGKPSPQVVQYDYETKLDIAKVVAHTPLPVTCDVIPMRMAYEDSQGTLKAIQYRVEGKCRDASG